MMYSRLTPKQQGILAAFDAEHTRLCALADAAEAQCDYHPCPPPKIGRLFGTVIQPKGCTCYTNDPNWQAFMNLEPPFCNLCGGWERCKPDCDALDRR